MEDIKKAQEELFKKAIQLNVNEHTEQKDDLTYLSWAWAWQEFLKICPDATYEIVKFTNPITGRTTSYLEDEDLGFMVYTRMTACGITREMWLPVMDNSNKAMKRNSYSYTVGKGDRRTEKIVNPATMFDINKAIMRCLTKNIAMFGVGLYIYAGEDLPIEIGEPCTDKQIARMRELKVNEANVKVRYNIKDLSELTYKQAEFIIATKEKSLEGGKK